MEITTNKWNFVLGFFQEYGSVRYYFTFGIFRIVTRPPEGYMVSRKDYNGFWIKWMLPFEMGISKSFGKEIEPTVLNKQ